MKWGNISEKTGFLPDVKNGVSVLYGKLPEWLFVDTVEFQMNIMHFSSQGWKSFPMEHILSMMRHSITVINSEGTITNPYFKGKILELLSLFAASDKKKEILPQIVMDSFC